MSLRASVATLAAVLLSTWSGNALSASWSSEDCEQSIERKDSAVSIAELTARLVDHVTIEPRLSDADNAPLTAGTAVEHHTPLLYLSPRVASVLRDIFGEAAPADVEQQDSPSSTLAEIEPNTEIEQDADPHTGQPEAQEAPALPLFQRQMYRIDI